MSHIPFRCPYCAKLEMHPVGKRLPEMCRACETGSGGFEAVPEAPVLESVPDQSPVGGGWMQVGGVGLVVLLIAGFLMTHSAPSRTVGPVVASSPELADPGVAASLELPDPGGTAEVSVKPAVPASPTAVVQVLAEKQDLTKTNPSQQPFNLTALIQQVEPSVVRIDVKLPSGGAVGSGFVASASGRIVTNRHVIEDAVEASVLFHNGRRTPVLGVLAVDSNRDIAVLQVAVESLPVPISLQTKPPEKGEFVLAVGTPHGLSFTATEGIVSAVRKGAELKEAFGVELPGNWVQTSASISHGNSGGPLLDRTGRVVGINTLGLTKGQNLNFAISAADISDVLGKSSLTSLRSLPLVQETEKPSVATAAGNGGPSDEIADQIRKQLDESTQFLQKTADEIDDKSHELKAAILEGQLEFTLKRLRSEIGRLQGAILDRINRPLKLPEIHPVRFSAGQFGTLGIQRLTVVQVLDKSKGSILAKCDPRDGGMLFKVHGLDLTNVIDGQSLGFRENLAFAVLGTTTYATVSGGTNTVFEIGCVADVSAIPAFEKFRKLATQPIDPVLSEEELAEVEKLKASRRAMEREEERYGRAYTMLNFAKAMLQKGKRDKAVEYLEKAIKEGKGTKLEEEASALLNEIR